MIEEKGTESAKVKAESEDNTSPKERATRSRAKKAVAVKTPKQPSTRKGNTSASKSTSTKGKGKSTSSSAKFPRHPLLKVLRIPRAILEQNAGQPCSERESAAYVGVGFGGPYQVEISSAIKYGLLERPSSGLIGLTSRARSILRPQRPEDELESLREAALAAPDIGEVYRHFRGENLPDPQFFKNALIDKFKIPEERVAEFEQIFFDTLKTAKLIEESGGKRRLIDVSQSSALPKSDEPLRRLGKQISVKSTDTCFVMMPFAPPIGNYYSLIYEAAIQKAGLTPVRADTDIFATGKIIDQIWRGIKSAKILVAELTGRNPNVFYELGLAHALDKPVVLVCSNQDDVPFDLQHIRVIYYDVSDPFWGNKLIEKIAENVLSAIKNPEEAVFSSALVGGDVTDAWPSSS